MLSVNLDSKHDILYLRIDDTMNSYGDEIENGLVVLKDMCSDVITGITIFDFIEKYKEGKIDKLNLPVKIDFIHEVYPIVQSYLQ